MSPPTYLTQRGGIWYAQVPVPKVKQAALGRKTLERSLRTRDHVQALRARHEVIADFHKMIREAGTDPAAVTAADLLRIARELRAAVDAGAIGERSATVELDATVDLLLERRAKEVGTDAEGVPTLPSDEVAKIRRATAALSGTDARMLEPLAERWLKHEASAGIKRATLADKQRFIEAFVKWAGGGTEAASITKPKASDYVEEVLLPWAVTADTKRFALNSVRQMFDWMETRGVIKANPFDKVGRLIRDAARGEVEGDGRRSWQPEEALKLLQVLPKDDPMWPLAALSMYTGARPEELCTMRVSNVTDETMFNPSGKTPSARRQIPVHPIIRPLVERLREGSDDGFLIPGLLTAGHDDKRGTLLGKRLAYWIRKKAGLSDPALVAYGFRRTVVTQMEAAGVPLYVRQQVAGHKAMNVTEASYTDPASVARRLEAIAHVTYGSEVDGLVEAAGGTLVVKKVARRRAKRAV